MAGIPGPKVSGGSWLAEKAHAQQGAHLPGQGRQKENLLGRRHLPCLAFIVHAHKAEGGHVQPKIHSGHRRSLIHSFRFPVSSPAISGGLGLPGA